jgi:hypothetical protein
MRSFLITLLCISTFLQLRAQRSLHEIQKVSHRKMKSLDSTGWEKSGFFLLNVNQAAQNEWSGGGENFLIGVNSLFNYTIHHLMGKFSFDSYIDIELGAVEASSFRRVRKTIDRCDFTFELEHVIGKKTNYGLLFNLNSQIFNGRNYASPDLEKVSAFLSPGKFLLAPGIDIKLKSETSYFSVFVSPATLKWVTKLDRDFLYQSKFGVDSAQQLNTEFGAYLSSHFNMKFSNSIGYIGRFDLFSNYKDKPGNIDVLMNNLFSFSISKFFSANVLVDIVYDEDVKSRTQVQEIFGLGIKLKL